MRIDGRISAVDTHAAGEPGRVIVGGVPDVVGEEEAVLIPAEDPIGLRETLTATINDPVGREARAAAAKRRFEQTFSLSNWVSLHDRVYAEALRIRDAE